MLVRSVSTRAGQINGLLDSTTFESATDSCSLATEHLTHLLEAPLNKAGACGDPNAREVLLGSGLAAIQMAVLAIGRQLKTRRY